MLLELLYDDVNGKTVSLGIIKFDKMVEHTRLCLQRFLNFVIFNKPSPIPREFDHFLENLTTSSQALEIKMCGWIKFINYFLLIAIKNNWIKDEELNKFTFGFTSFNEFWLYMRFIEEYLKEKDPLCRRICETWESFYFKFGRC